MATKEEVAENDASDAEAQSVGEGDTVLEAVDDEHEVGTPELVKVTVVQPEPDKADDLVGTLEAVYDNETVAHEEMLTVEETLSDNSALAEFCSELDADTVCVKLRLLVPVD